MPSPTKTVRRSVSLPPDLVAEAVESAPQALKNNFNRLVRTALEEYIETRKAKVFAEQMRAMAADPDVQREITTINKEFMHADADGLGEGG
jgi:metal-responsive CopG/Arc/MetJ family transcriptional regulator